MSGRVTELGGAESRAWTSRAPWAWRAANPASALHAEVAALPLAAAAAVTLARALPVRFEHRPNDLGIVSVATIERYPLQQETFWFVVAVGFGVAGALALGAWLARRSWSTGRGIALEAAAVATLALVLLAPPWTALAPLAAVAALAWRAPRAGAGASAAFAPPAASFGQTSSGQTPPPQTSPPRRHRRLWAACALLVAAAMSPGLVLHGWRVAQGTPDAEVTADDWNFHGESGQHLAWCDSIRAGRMQGRDYFSLYGPYLELGLVGLWELVGRSISALNLYVAFLFAAGFAGALALGSTLCRRRVVALALVAVALPINLRYGLALAALATLAPWLRGGPRAWCAAAGALGGFALFFSQEFGLAFVLVAALALAVRADARAAAAFAAGAALTAAPVLAWFVAEGALVPLARDMAGYPAWMAAGYGKLPFPSLLAALPLGLGDESAPARFAYVGPAVSAAALALALAPLAGGWRAPLAAWRAWRASSEPLLLALVALFGLIAFRTALGRSDAQHVGYVLGAPAVLLVVALDRSLALASASRALAAWRVVCVAALAWFGGLPQRAQPLNPLQSAARVVDVAFGDVEPARGSARVNAIAAWLREHTEPGDGVTFVPAGAAYHYLTERRDPTRFVLSHQMVTDAHRAEALADLRRAPPRFVVFDPGALRVDGVPDRVVLGPALADWLDQEYEPETAVSGARIRRRKGAEPVEPGAPRDSRPAPPK